MKVVIVPLGGCWGLMGGLRYAFPKVPTRYQRPCLTSRWYLRVPQHHNHSHCIHSLRCSFGGGTPTKQKGYDLPMQQHIKIQANKSTRL